MQREIHPFNSFICFYQFQLIFFEANADFNPTNYAISGWNPAVWTAFVRVQQAERNRVVRGDRSKRNKFFVKKHLRTLSGY